MRGARWLVDSLRAKQDIDKSLGQHFLVSDELIARAVELAEVNSNVAPGTLLTAIVIPPVVGTSPLCKSRSFDIGVKRNSSSRLVGVGKSLGSKDRITGV